MPPTVSTRRPVRRASRASWLLSIVVLLALVAGCGGSSGSDDDAAGDDGLGQRGSLGEPTTLGLAIAGLREALGGGAAADAATDALLAVSEDVLSDVDAGVIRPADPATQDTPGAGAGATVPEGTEVPEGESQIASAKSTPRRFKAAQTSNAPEPIYDQKNGTTVDQVGPATVSTTRYVAVADWRTTVQLDTTTTITSPERAQLVQKQKVDLPVCPDDDGVLEGTWTADWSSTTDIESRRITGTAVVRAQLDAKGGLVSIDLLDVEIEALRQDGAGTLNGRAVVRGAARGLGRDGETYRQEGQARASDDAMLQVGMDSFSALVGYAELSAKSAATLSGRYALEGMCLQIEPDTRGVTSLAPGASTVFDARTVDVRTGEEIEGLPIVAVSSGAVTPEEAPSPATFDFIAPTGRPPYEVFLSVHTLRGGHDTSVVYDGTGGYRIQQQVMQYTASGQICDIDAPFEFTMTSVGSNGTMTVTPDGNGGGTYRFTGIHGGIPATVTGAVQITKPVDQDGSPQIHFGGGTWVLSTPLGEQRNTSGETFTVTPTLDPSVRC